MCVCLFFSEYTFIWAWTCPQISKTHILFSGALELFKKLSKSDFLSRSSLFSSQDHLTWWRKHAQVTIFFLKKLKTLKSVQGSEMFIFCNSKKVCRNCGNAFTPSWSWSWSCALCRNAKEIYSDWISSWRSTQMDLMCISEICEIFVVQSFGKMSSRGNSGKIRQYIQSELIRC